METSIYFFSGTGNSYKVAKDLSILLNNCEMIPIAKLIQQDEINCVSERVGFIFPLYFQGAPAIIFDFINKLNLHKSKYLFAIITSHGGGAGSTIYQLNKLLKSKSKEINAGFSIEMPGNYIPMYSIISEHQQKKILKNAEEKVKKIAEIIKNNEKVPKKQFFQSIGAFINKIFCKNVNKGDKNFSVNEKCNSCEICEKICPVKNIKTIDGKPQWQHKCQRCLACIHFCPTEAIQYGKKTIKRGRYHHPDVQIADIINQSG